MKKLKEILGEIGVALSAFWVVAVILFCFGVVLKLLWIAFTKGFNIV